MGWEEHLGVQSWMKKWKENAASVVTPVFSVPGQWRKRRQRRKKWSEVGGRRRGVRRASQDTFHGRKWSAVSGSVGSAIPIFLRALVYWNSLGGQHVDPPRALRRGRPPWATGQCGRAGAPPTRPLGAAPSGRARPPPPTPPLPHAGPGGPGFRGCARPLREPGPLAARAPRPLPARRARALAPAPTPAGGGGGDCFCCR